MTQYQWTRPSDERLSILAVLVKDDIVQITYPLFAQILWDAGYEPVCIPDQATR